MCVFPVWHVIFPCPGKRHTMKKQVKQQGQRNDTPKRGPSRTKRPRIRREKAGDTINKQSDDLPGYPHYPNSEDIMNRNEKKVPIDIEKPEAPIMERVNEIPLSKPPGTLDEEPDPDLVAGTEADVTKDEAEELGDDHLAMDMSDDEDLKHRVHPLDMAGEDLVVPGAELDDQDEAIGKEDEENNLYSLGGDKHDS